MAHPQGFSFWISVAFSVNYIMGCGFLGIPDAFVKSGMVLGPVVVILFFFAMNASKDYVLEAMARAEAMVKTSMIFERRLDGKSAPTGSPADASSDAARPHTSHVVPSSTDYLVSSLRKFEITGMRARPARALRFGAL